MNMANVKNIAGVKKSLLGVVAICAAELLMVVNVHAEDLVAQAYPVSGVTGVQVGGGAFLEISQGDTESLTVETTPEIMKRVKVDLTDHLLTLSVKHEGKIFNWFNNNNEKVRFILQVKQLSLMDLSGAVQATMGNYRGEKIVLKSSGASRANFANLQINHLQLDGSGASNIEIQTLTSQKMYIDLSGASNFKVEKSGKTNELKVGASGASNYHGQQLIAAIADVDASGASTIDLRVNETLKAEASGASNINYYGAAKVTSSATGASHVNARQ